MDPTSRRWIEKSDGGTRPDPDPHQSLFSSRSLSTASSQSFLSCPDPCRHHTPGPCSPPNPGPRSHPSPCSHHVPRPLHPQPGRSDIQKVEIIFLLLLCANIRDLGMRRLVPEMKRIIKVFPFKLDLTYRLHTWCSCPGCTP